MSANESERTAGGSRRPVRVDTAAPSMDRNFITVERAQAEFALTPEHLEGLRRTKRRSPYGTATPAMQVLFRQDVMQRAIQVWGSADRLKQEQVKREGQGPRWTESAPAGVGDRRRPRNERRQSDLRPAPAPGNMGLWGSSGRVILAAVAVNGSILVMKVIAWLMTGSHSMFAECLHSFADTANQIIIAVGVYTSMRRPSTLHPYGYSNMKFVTALISGVGIFCVGTGLSLYEGVSGLLAPSRELPDVSWALGVMGVSALCELVTLGLALRSLSQSARRRDMHIVRFILSSQDPSVNVVLTEDLAAVVSLALAAGCLLLSLRTSSSLPDAIGSVLVGLVLGAIAAFIISTSVGSLVGRSIPREELDRINSELEGDVMVRAIHDVKGIDMGNNMVRYKAELDFDGRQLTRAYLDAVDMAQLMQAVKSIGSMDDLEDFMLDHGENLVDMIGGQIDRIERKLKTSTPNIRHCDLEIL